MYFGDNLRGVTGEWLGKKTDGVSFPSNPGLFKTSLAVQTMGGGGGASRSDDIITFPIRVKPTETPQDPH